MPVSITQDAGRAPSIFNPSRKSRVDMRLSRRSLLFGTAAVLLLPPIGARLVRRNGWILRAEDV